MPGLRITTGSGGMAREKMTGVDTAWLRMDSPANLMMIVGVEIFDTPIAYDALAQRLTDRFLTYDRFRQKVVAEGGGYCWEDDEDFDIANHLVPTRLPGEAGDAELRELMAELSSQPLDPDRPLWEFRYVENYKGTVAVVIRIHHCIADGIALVNVTLSMTDGWKAPAPRARDAHDAHDDEPHHEGTHAWSSIIEPITRTAVKAAEATGGALGASVDIAADPEGLEALATVGSQVIKDALKVGLMSADSDTSLKGTPGGRKAVAWNEPMPLDEVKAVCKVLGVSVNDVLLSCVTGAIHHYLEGRGEPAAGKEFRAMVPVNLRPPDAPPSLGNRFGLVPLVLPIGIANPVERLYEVRRRMNELKQGYQGQIAFAILGAVGLAPKGVQRMLLDYLAQKGSAVMTNVPGPREHVTIAGVKLRQVIFWVPQSGSIGVGVSILSYGGAVQFGLITDTDLCAQPQAIIDAFQPEFERLVLTLCMLPRELVGAGPLDGQEIERRLLSRDGPAQSPAPAPKRAAGSRRGPASKAGASSPTPRPSPRAKAARSRAKATVAA